MTGTENAITVVRSDSLEDACNSFLGDLKNWAHSCIERYGDCAPVNQHDQLTYTTGWEPYIIASGDRHVIAFLEKARQDVASHFAGEEIWRHGYWRMQEAHHGTEHFELFLGFLARLDPCNQVTRSQLVDAVEHIGNWCAEVPDWFDDSTGLFRSLYFGTDGVREDELELNMPDHLRCASLLLLVYDLTQESRYLELAESYGERWAAAICNNPDNLPVGMTVKETIYELSGQGETAYRSFAGMAGLLDTDLDRAENILASGGVQLFLRLWKTSGKSIFLEAVRRLLSVLEVTLQDPDAGATADAIRAYRNVTGRDDLDSRVMQAVHDLAPLDVRSISMTPCIRKGKRPKGVGKRTDMPLWYEDGQPRRHSPVLLSLAAEIEDDRELATGSVDLARSCFELAVRSLPDGRKHGCAANTVNAVAAGHGRDNHAGMTTAVLLPVLHHFGGILDRTETQQA